MWPCVCQHNNRLLEAPYLRVERICSRHSVLLETFTPAWLSRGKSERTNLLVEFPSQNIWSALLLPAASASTDVPNPAAQ